MSSPIVISVPSVYGIPSAGSLPSSVYFPLSAFLTCNVMFTTLVLKFPPPGDADTAGKFDSAVCSIRIKPLAWAVNVATPSLTTVSTPVYASRTTLPSANAEDTFTLFEPEAPIATTTVSSIPLLE
ncbi:hypothetical protein D3C77_480230 [compost metagenome]